MELRIGRVLPFFQMTFQVKGRLVALFLLAIFVTPILAQPTAVMASSLNDFHDSKVSTASAQPLKTVSAKNIAAADQTRGDASSLLGLNKIGQVGDLLSINPKSTKAVTPHELTEERSATSDTKLNSDGTFTKRQYTSPKYFKADSVWQKIDTTLIEDKNAADSDNFAGKLLGQVQSLIKNETTFTVRANDWKARFAPSDSSEGMVRIQENDNISFSPVSSNSVVPVLVSDDKQQQSVWYYDLWDGVDVQYIVKSDQLKENILIKNKTANNEFKFRISDGRLVADQHSSDTGNTYVIKDALGDKFSLSKFTLTLNKYGYEAEQPIAQSLNGDVLTVSVDRTYLSRLPNDAFPVNLDPTVTNSSFGTRSGGNYFSYKSDGSVCNSTTCNPLTGSVKDTSNIWRSWRSTIHSPFTFLQGKKFINASVHLTQRLGISTSGSTNTEWFNAAWASCQGYNCMGTTANGAYINYSGDIDVTYIYASKMDVGDWGVWLMLYGDETAATTYKNWDPDNSYVSFTYANYTPTPTITTPVSNQIYIDPQVSITASNPGNPNSGTPLRYGFCVSAAPGCTSTVIGSGDITANQWTIPDGILQDGNTYYAQVRALDPDGGGGYSGYSTPVPFKIEMRRGKDKTQSYDTVGPVDIDLATGNVSTSNTSHSSSALGGSMGVSVDYNSPMRSRTGLVGQYYSNDNLSGDPVLTRTDQSVDFAWDNGSPSTLVPSDSFSARWTGYFVAPQTGTYQFGNEVDDGCRIWVNDQLLVNDWTWCNGQYGSAISLTAGQIVSVKMEYREIGGAAVARLKVKGIVSSSGMVIPKEWLQTGVRPLTQNNGLTGRYYNYNGDKNLDATTNTNYMTRVDPLLSMDWGSSPAIANSAGDFMVRWTGYITLPTAGAYNFGTNADDGTRIKIDGNTVMDNWNGSCCTLLYGASTQLTTGTHSITVDMYDSGGAGKIYMYIKGAVAEQVVPSSWLTTKSQVLPNGWNLGIDPDGELSYDRLVANANSVVLSDSTGATHEYMWTGSGYRPPVNEDGYLIRNPDGTFSLNDDDGKTYVFSNGGVLTSVTSPVDDRHPAALAYSYIGSPAKIRQISDGVDINRNAKVYYSGETECGNAPSGFDPNAPINMLCAVLTNDGRATYFYYIQGNLARIVKPGNDTTDYQYDTLGRIVSVRDTTSNDAINAAIRTADSSVLTELIYDNLGRASSIIAPSATLTSTRQQQTFEYLPGATGYTGATLEHIVGDAEPNGFSRRIEYDSLLRTIKDTDVTNSSLQQQWDVAKDLLYSSVDATGLKSTTIFDSDDRPVDAYGAAPSAWFDSDNKPTSSYVSQVPRTSTGYDEGINGPSVAFMALSKPNDTLANGQSMIRGTTLTSRDGSYRFTYQNDGNLVIYNPYGSMWSSHTDGVTSNVLTMQPDGNLVLYNGSSAVWHTYTYSGGSSSRLVMQGDGNLVIYNNSGSTWASGTNGAWSTGSMLMLTGAPLLHTNNIGTNSTQISNNFGSTSPIDGQTTNWGMRMSGKTTLASSGNWAFRVVSDAGVRVNIDDIAIINDWNDGGTRSRTGYFNANISNGVLHRLSIDYYHMAGNNAEFTLYITPPGGSETSLSAQYIKPDYNLQTSTKTYGVPTSTGQTSTVINTTNYGTNPELGLAQSTSVDSAGINLTTTNTYEQQGATGSYLRQTSSTLAGGVTTNYTYYGATETMDNPCTTSVTEAYRQGGMLKFKTDPDPDGAGTQTGRITQSIYNDSGVIIATRYNNDNWTCTSYDSRGRTTSTVLPAYNGSASRTVNNSYVVGGNPLISSTQDSAGTTVVETDILGRVVRYVDTLGGVTTSTYDAKGRLTGRVSGIGTELYVYDQFDRLTDQKLDGITYAHVTYDTYSRISDVTYQNGLSLSSIGHDALGRVNSLSYGLASSQTLSDQVTRAITGDVVSGTELGQTKIYQYDTASRLVNANIASNIFNYAYGTQSSSCANNTNINSGKDGNRTSQTINGVSTTHCYDYADRLVNSSNAGMNDVVYDSHGNTTSIGSTGNVTDFGYDSSDRLISMTETAKNISVNYSRDSQGRVTNRNETKNSQSLITKYNYTAAGDTPDYLTNSSGTITEKYISLPGNVMLTIRPQSTSAGIQSWSLPNIHGDNFAIVNADGSLASTTLTGPYGEAINGQSIPNNFTSDASYSYLGQYQKQTEVAFTLQPMDMGARTYIPMIGRFLQMDPVKGGTPNDYAYSLDPVNENDLTGACVGRFMSICARAIPVVDRVTNRWANKAVKVVKLGSSKATQLSQKLVNSFKSKPSQAYSRPSNATTNAQRASVQGQTCVTCGGQSPRMIADHKVPLVQEYYTRGKIDEQFMRSLKAVQPQCATCSAQQGAQMRIYSIEQRRKMGF